MPAQRSTLKGQRGAFLLEALIGILIFSMGILALMGLQAVSIKNTVEAKYRSEASYLANQIIARMWIDVANVDKYATAGAAYDARDAWTAQVADLLPGATDDDAPTITVTAPASVDGAWQVVISIFWRSPGDPNRHSFVTVANISPS